MQFKGVFKGLAFRLKFDVYLEVTFESSVKGANFGKCVPLAFSLVLFGFASLVSAFVAGGRSEFLLRGGGGGIQSVSSPLPQRCVVTGRSGYETALRRDPKAS